MPGSKDKQKTRRNKMEKKAHDLALLRLGKGIVKFDRYDDNGLPTGLRDLGNVPSMTLSPAEESVDHYSAREAVKTMDTILTLSRKITGKFTCEEFDRETLRMALFGGNFSSTLKAWKIQGLTAGVIQGLLDFWPTNAQGPKYHLQVWNARLKVTGDVGMIDDTAIGKMDFEFTAQYDATHAALTPSSPYFDYTLIDES
jgi:hypothetical protein